MVSSEPGTYLAGLAWGFGSYHFAHLIHLQLQSLYFLPLTFLFLHRLMAGRRTRDLVLLGVTTALQAISSVYYGVIGGLALVVGGVALAVGVGRWRNTAVLKRLAFAATLAAVLVAEHEADGVRGALGGVAAQDCLQRRREPRGVGHAHEQAPVEAVQPALRRPAVLRQVLGRCQDRGDETLAGRRLARPGRRLAEGLHPRADFAVVGLTA